jgi:putative membrane protein
MSARQQLGSLMSAEEGKRVSDAIEAVERTTAGEIMVVVAARSDVYADVRGLLAMVGAVASAWTLYWFLPTVPSGYIFGGEVLLWLLFWWLTGTGAVIRAVVPASRLALAVDNKAKQVFMDHGLTETRDRSGVLILVSELEHRVEILADRGIHEVVGNQGWENEVNGILRAIRDGNPTSGLVEAVEHIGARLAQSFPPRPDDVNELTDHVRYID